MTHRLSEYGQNGFNLFLLCPHPFCLTFIRRPPQSLFPAPPPVPFSVPSLPGMSVPVFFFCWEKSPVVPEVHVSIRKSLWDSLWVLSVARVLGSSTLKVGFGHILLFIRLGHLLYSGYYFGNLF